MSNTPTAPTAVRKKDLKQMAFSTASGIPDIKRKTIRCFMARSRTDLLRALVSHRVAISAGDDGSITAWRDDEGNYRAEFHRWTATKSQHTSKTKAQLNAWLKKWWPRLQERFTP